jgi:hypothetical protein
MTTDTIYEIQALGRHGIWDAEYIDSDPYATKFSTLEEAEQELDNLVVIQGRDRDTLRIREITPVRRDSRGRIIRD